MYLKACFIFLASALSAAAAFAWDHHVGSASKCAGTAHQPAPDVAYQTGVDAQGWAVAPAELSPPPLAPEDVQNPKANLDLPLGKYLKRPESYNTDLSETDLSIGTLKVENDTVTLSGKDLRQEEPVDPECQ